MLAKIYILLPVHNRLDHTKGFIQSLLAQSYDHYHLVLIDDGSRDGTTAYVASKVKDLSVLKGHGDWWWGGGLHQGYCWLKEKKVSAGDLVLMVNNDTEFGADFFQTAVALLGPCPRTLLLARVYGKYSGKCVEAGVHVDWRRLSFEHTEDAAQVNCLSTRGLFLRAGDLMGIGGFHPVLLPHYLSDYEFTIRAHGKGYRLVTDPSLKLRVDESATGVYTRQRSTGRVVFFRDYFSKGSSDNPFYWFSFVALACPWALKPWNFLRVLYGGLATVFRKTFGIYNDKWC
jgi:GT2 family glycosyltransferase